MVYPNNLLTFGGPIFGLSWASTLDVVPRNDPSLLMTGSIEDRIQIPEERVTKVKSLLSN